MFAEETDVALVDEIRSIVADIVETDVAEIGWTTHFWDDLGADSLQGIEILSALERRLEITIDQSRLVDMQDVKSTYEVVMVAREGAVHGAS